MGRLLDIAVEAGREANSGTYRVYSVNDVGQREENEHPEGIAGRAYAVNAINAVSPSAVPSIVPCLPNLRAELTRLHDYIIRLRYEDPPRGSRQDALAYVAVQAERLGVRSEAVGGTAHGWPDPTDAFADGDQLVGLWAALEEMAAGPYPAPLPAGCVLLPQTNFDVFAAGRLYNGMVKTSEAFPSACG